MRTIPADSSLVSPARSLVRLTLFAALTVPAMLLQAVAMLLRLPLRERLPQWYHRQLARLIGVRIERRGRMSRRRPTLFVSNHISYLDIMVLGALIRGSFVAKAEIADWPVFGWLARLQRSVFVERRARHSAAHRDQLGRRLSAGDSLILFPEGTSGDGNSVLRFKSTLFAAAELQPKGEPLTVQPVTIAYTRLDGMPMGRALRPFFAWYGDMDLPGHLWRALGMGRLTVQVHFHPPVTLEQLGSRKALAEHCQREVAEGLASALAGRPQRMPQPAAAPAAAQP